MYLCKYQAAVLPSFTDSTVVSATPATSPPQNTHSKLDCIVRVSTSGNPHLLNFSGCIAPFTTNTHANTQKNYENFIEILILDSE